MSLSDNEFLLKALHSYTNVQCNTLEEFESDLNRIFTIKKLLSKYENCGELNERLILNHITVLTNVFGLESTQLLLAKIPKEQYKYLFPFLIMLNIITEEDLSKSDTLDIAIIEKLRGL